MDLDTLWQDRAKKGSAEKLLKALDEGHAKNVADIVQKFADERISIIRQDHKGIAAARNFGNEQAKAPFLPRGFPIRTRLLCQDQRLLDEGGEQIENVKRRC